MSSDQLAERTGASGLRFISEVRQLTTTVAKKLEILDDLREMRQVLCLPMLALAVVIHVLQNVFLV